MMNFEGFHQGFFKNLGEATLTNNNITLEDADDIQSIDAQDIHGSSA